MVKIPFIQNTRNTKESASASKQVKPKKSRFIFFIGDEGGILVHMKGATVARRLFSPSADPETSSAIRELLRSNPQIPTYVLIDMMDQSYVKHTLPPVTKFSVQKLIKRRLERDFSPEDIKGALPLGRDKDGRRDWNYLLISLASSPMLMQWMDFITELENPLRGIYLVPVESEQFIAQLRKRLLPESKARWQLLVMNNKVGGFRQVIMKDGRLAFTRLTQAVGDNSPEVIAGNIEQEILNTIEYLKRLSYNDDEALEIFVVVSDSIRNHIDPARFKNAHSVAMTPHEAAGYLQLESAALPEDHYSDVIFSAFFGSLKKHILPLQTSLSQKLQLFYTARKAAIITTYAVAVLTLGYMAVSIPGIVPLIEDKQKLEERTTRIEESLATLKSKAEMLPADLERINDVVSIYELFEEQKHFPLSFIRSFIEIMPEYVVVRRFDWNAPESLERRFSNEKAEVKISLQIEFLNNSGSVDEFQKSTDDFFKRMRLRFPEFYLTHSKLPGTIQKDERFETVIGQDTRNASSLYLDGRPIIVDVDLTTSDPNQNNKRGRRR